MATQSAASIPFTHTTPQQNYRLLELPPEILELLTSDNPPILRLKSALPSTDDPASSSSSGPSTANENLHLCTPTRTYQIRQVQSSNSVFLVRPAPLVPASPPDGQDDGAHVDLNTTSTGLTAVAQCNTTLELVGVKSDVGALLERGLPVWRGQEEEEEEEEIRSKENVLEDTPVSEVEFELAWRDMCCFEYTRGGGRPAVGYRPSAESCVKVWERVMQAVVLNGIRLEGEEAEGCVSRVLDLYNDSDGDPAEDLDEPWELLEAVLRRVGDGEGGVNRAATVKWVGEILLKAETEVSGIGVDTEGFLERWKAQVPERWRDDAKIEALEKGSYRVDVGHGTICFASSAGSAAKDGGWGASATGSGTANNKRKWHERFKAGRK